MGCGFCTRERRRTIDCPQSPPAPSAGALTVADLDDVDVLDGHLLLPSSGIP
jgi:hypothetical protein